jgi:phenylalanyl-tRNA synthetase beta chain
MKVPISWLHEYVDIDISIPDLIERLTLAGLEVASVRVFGLPIPNGLAVKPEDVGPVWEHEKIVIGKVLTVAQHPNADRLKLVSIDYGAAEPKVVVTGAPNIAVGDSGQRIILALTGSVLFDGHSEQKVLKKLEPTKLRGIPSDAMVCSAYELGISDEHEGIILLEEDAPIGMPLAEFMGEIVLELEITPNLARCLSIIGVAREVAALTGKTVRLPDRQIAYAGDRAAAKVSVSIEDPTLSARYTAMCLANVKIGPAPGWLQRRLTYAGMRPINNIVDVTNYVMLEWGQPLHAFDYDRLAERAGGKKPELIVRPARPGEKLTTLDKQVRELTPDMLLIADAAGPVALAGVMGGLETEVTPQTTRVVLESANFDFRSIRRTMKALNLPSEASVRFSKGIHPELVKPAAERACALMQKAGGAEVLQGAAEAYPSPLDAKPIELRTSEIRRLLGFDFPLDDAQRILQALDFQVAREGDTVLRVTPPPYRVDIQEGPADVIEDLARIYGYNRLPATLLADSLPEQHTDDSLWHEERIRDLLVNLGLQEVINYALTDPGREQPLGAARADFIRLLNPIHVERGAMRQRLLPGILDGMAANFRHQKQIRLFEIGPVFLPQPGAKLPAEPLRLAIALLGSRVESSWADSGLPTPAPLDFYDLKGIVEALVDELHLEGVAYAPAKTTHLHPGKSAELLVGQKALGVFGQLHPKAATHYGLAGQQVWVAEIDLEELIKLIPPRHTYVPVPRFPAALRDLAVIVKEDLPMEKVQSEIRAGGGDLLHQVNLFDLYRGDSIPPGTKSLAFSLAYLADDRTLTDKEVDKAHKKIADRLKHVLKAQIRGEEATKQ